MILKTLLRSANIEKISQKQIESLSGNRGGGKGREGGFWLSLFPALAQIGKSLEVFFGPISRNSISNKNPYLILSLLGEKCSNFMLNVLILLQNEL